MRFRYFLALLFPLLLVSLRAGAQARDDQFKSDPFSQTYADTTDKSPADSSQLFSFKEYFGGLAHKRTASLKTLTMGSAVFLGGTQIYNRDYWKLPIVYGGIGAGIGLGIYYNNQFKQTQNEAFKKYSTYAFLGAGITYWASLLDGAASFERGRYPNPAKSTVYSILLPGLGQIYNGEYWKIPLYWGLLAGGVYFYTTNNRNYQRFRWIYQQGTSEDPTVEAPPIPAETALYYRDAYRRLRDYSILFTAIFYVVQIIDANVFAYMQDFEVNDDITLKVSPTLIDTQQYASQPAMGMGISLRF